MTTTAPTFPFAAVVGQTNVKLALILLAIDPHIGGVCISGPRGSAKSTLARSLIDLMVDGAENFVTLPLAASEEMVIGTLDLQGVLDQQKVSLQPGLVQHAHNGVLYVDEVNLLADNLVDILLDVTASGINTIERDGISHQHEARFIFIGTMNPDEGELRPQLLDRFALSASLQTDYITQERIDIVRRRDAFDWDAKAFCAEFQSAQTTLAEQIAEAQTKLTSVELSDELRKMIAERCVAAQVDGLRADIVWTRTAKTHAAWQSRTHVTVADINAVEELVLSHRRQSQPNQNQNQPPPTKPFSRPDADKPSNNSDQDETNGDWGSMPPVQQMTAQQRYFDPAKFTALTQRPPMSASNQIISKNGTKQQSLNPSWFQTFTVNKGVWPLTSLCFKDRRSAPTILHMILLDTSASTLGHHIFAQAKAVVVTIAEQAYLARQQITLVGFGNQQVIELLSKRRAPKQIKSLLDDVSAGGGTPLRESLLHTQAMCKKQLHANAAIQFVHYLITDGRSRQDLRNIRLLGQCILIDTESTSIKRGRGVELATMLNAQYIALASLAGIN